MTDRQDISPEKEEFCFFLQQHSPFAELPLAVLQSISSQLTITYHRAHTQIQLDEQQRCLYIVRSGSVIVTDTDNRLVDKVSVGSCFGFPALLSQKPASNSIEALEDSLIYQLDDKSFKELCDEYENFALFFDQQYTKRIQNSLEHRQQNSLYSQQVKQLMSTTLISVDPTTSILDAARLMSNHRISSLIVTDQNQSLLGIITDRDLRQRVIAEERSFEEPVQVIMTKNPVVITSSAFVDQAILLMAQNNIHHLPVIENDKPLAVITVSDIVRQQKSDPIFLMSTIYKAQSVDELVHASHRIKGLLQNLIAADIKAEALGRLLTTVTDALTQRLIQLAQEKLGPEPVAFTWLAFGSQGRQDQSAKSDQDNGLLLDDDVQPEHDEYFSQLAHFVCDGLDACGYVYCPGNIMATNTQWRQPLKAWQSAFENWVQQPGTKSLLHASIFFDLRMIYSSTDDDRLIKPLQSLLKNLVQNQHFLSSLTINALNLQPPLGFFKQFVMDRSGEHKNTFDIKKQGLMPLTDIARIHALAKGILPVNSIERFQQLNDKNVLDAGQANNLLDAHEFIAHLRLVHQGQQMEQGIAPDNHINPAELSGLMQRQLKDAFQIVRDAQKSLRFRYAKDLPS